MHTYNALVHIHITVGLFHIKKNCKFLPSLLRISSWLTPWNFQIFFIFFSHFPLEIHPFGLFIGLPSILYSTPLLPLHRISGKAHYLNKQQIRQTSIFWNISSQSPIKTPFIWAIIFTNKYILLMSQYFRNKFSNPTDVTDGQVTFNTESPHPNWMQRDNKESFFMKFWVFISIRF